MWNKLNIYQVPRQDSGQKNIPYTRYSENSFTHIYRDLYGEAVLVPTWMGTKLGGRKPTKTSVTEFGYKSVNLFLEELINIK